MKISDINSEKIKMKEWQYQEEDYINEFVKYVGKDSRLSATLVPNIPEFIDALCDGIYPDKIPEIGDYLVKKGERLSEEQIRTLSLMSLCKRHNIRPFLALSFDGFTPELRYIGPNANDWGIYSDGLYKICVQPFQFTGNKKWYQIFFKNFIGERVEDAKVGIEGFVKDGYKLISVRTELNPRSYTSDHYYDYEKVDLTVSISKGKIAVYTDISKDFEIPTTKDSLRDFFTSKK